MREIKFRAWDIKNKKYIEIIGFYYFDDHIVLWFLDNNGIPNYKNYHMKGIILEQYTGLKDKNDVEIYEGDIVSIDYENEKIIAICVYFENRAEYGFKTKESYLSGGSTSYAQCFYEHFKIINNIHEATL